MNKKEESENESLAMSILRDFKKENKALKILLGLSIITNILIVILK